MAYQSDLWHDVNGPPEVRSCALYKVYYLPASHKVHNYSQMVPNNLTCTEKCFSRLLNHMS